MITILQILAAWFLCGYLACLLQYVLIRLGNPIMTDAMLPSWAVVLLGFLGMFAVLEISLVGIISALVGAVMKLGRRVLKGSPLLALLPNPERAKKLYREEGLPRLRRPPPLQDPTYQLPRSSEEP